MTAEEKYNKASAMENENPHEALKLLLEIYDYSPAAYKLAGWYKRGKYVDKNEKESLRFCRLAADFNHPGAQSTLGGYYERGEMGLTVNYEEAAKWYRKALANGADKFTQDKLDRLISEGKLKGGSSSSPRSSSSTSPSYTPAKKGGAVKTVIIAAIVLFVLFYGGRFVIGLFSRTKPAAATTQAQPAAAAATITSNVNFRRGPSTSNEIIRQLQQGDAVTLTGETSSGWTQVRHGNDTGWVSTEFLTQNATQQTASTNSRQTTQTATQEVTGPQFSSAFIGTWKPETSEWTGGSITFTATKVIIGYVDYNLIEVSGDVYSVNDGFKTLPLTLKLVNGKLELTEGRYGQMDGTWEKQ